MSDRFSPISMEQLTAWIFDELAAKSSIFGIPRPLFFAPQAADPFARSVYGTKLETPFGVAAGPHSQMAQNIIAAWLCGARFIELKTVQTLDELDVPKPCIDMEDEGYNVEWSQELKVEQSFAEYLRAWVLIHALHDCLGFPGTPRLIFNMSVGYDLAGIHNDNVRWYLEHMRDAGDYYEKAIDAVAARHPRVRDLDIPRSMSDSVTLSTMHGCPPDEIGKISEHLINDWELHTSVKLNPTLLGPERVRHILNDTLGFSQVTVPDAAFAHDLKWTDAVELLAGLRDTAAKAGVVFGVKLTNTLEVQNHRAVFAAAEKMMYLSGRPLHALTVNLAHQISDQFAGELLMSFAGGANAFNVAQLLRAGMCTVTACSDLLESGGYLRLLQYIENAASAMAAVRARNLDELVCASAGLAEWPTDRHGRAVEAADGEPMSDVVAAARLNLARYAEVTLGDRELARDTYARHRSKTPRTLDLFDCIEAPCVDECNIDQRVPQYMNLVRDGRFAEAVEVTRADNVLATVLGRACDHRCEYTCVRTHYDEPLAIREMKRFVMEHEETPAGMRQQTRRDVAIGIVGAGPCGLSAAYFLGSARYRVTLFEAHPFSGGQVSGTIPIYRLPQPAIAQDVAFLERFGVTIEYDQRAGRDFTLTDLQARGFSQVIVAVGAQVGARLGIDGDDAEGVYDGLTFLRAVREDHAPQLGAVTVVIGGGDVAMDCARSARRLTHGEVTVVYRRAREQMPAQGEEIIDLLAEGCKLHVLASPIGIGIKSGRIANLTCERMELGAEDDSGRRRPVPTGERFTLEVDNLLLAIGQKTDLGFFGNVAVATDARGYVSVDRATRETSIANVYAGGDVIGESPLSIVKAMGDGKTIAAEIRRRVEGVVLPAPPAREIDLVDLMRRRARRERRVAIPHRPVSERGGFDEVLETLEPQSARAEAGRCLDCDVLCSICVTVCPNLAFFTYETAALRVALPLLRRDGGGAFTQEPGASFAVDQAHQVAVLSDFCNECGNCTTFCPTAGEPYKDKPRLHLNVAQFAAQADNAFMVGRDGDRWSVRGRYAGATHELRLDERVHYASPDVRAELLPQSLELVRAEPTADCPQDVRVTLTPCAQMYLLLRGLRESMGHLPLAP